MRVVLGTAVVALMLATGPVFAEDDDKTSPGTACVPAKPANADDFRYTRGGIQYVRSSGRGTVDCHVLRDRVDDDESLDRVRIYFNKADSGGPNLSCQANFRSLDDGSILDSESASEVLQGDGTMSFFDIDYDDERDASLSVRCKLPSDSRIHGIEWKEDD